MVYLIENSPKNAKYRRVATVYAKNENEATQKLLQRFPDATDLRFIKEARLANPTLSHTIIK